MTTTAEIQTWLCSRIAERTGLDPSEVDPGQPFATFGIGSRDAVELVAQLQDSLGRQLRTTLLYDYPTIKALADELAAGAT